jgi:V-type H+-transporting ATPase proteolipid subunit
MSENDVNEYCAHYKDNYIAYPANVFDETAEGMMCPTYAKFLGAMGATASMSFSAMGAAYGTAKASIGMAECALLKPELLMKSLIPIVMAGITAIYGLVVSVLISNSLGDPRPYGLFKGFLDLGAGLSVGIAGAAAGYSTGVAGDDGDRAIARQPRFFVGFILILVFAGVPGLYGLIVALLLNTKGDLKSCHAAPYNPCCDAGILGYPAGGDTLGCYQHTF